jgi:F0F1-type ATP synthase membrane subunit b/b'
LTQDIEQTASAIRSEVSTGLADVKELSKEYTDEKVTEASTFAHNENVALNASIAAAIAETDASIRQTVATELNIIVNDYHNYTD